MLLASLSLISLAFSASGPALFAAGTSVPCLGPGLVSEELSAYRVDEPSWDPGALGSPTVCGGHARASLHGCFSFSCPWHCQLP